MTTNRKWLPNHYSDEVIPAPRISPTAWVVTREDGSWELAANEIADMPMPIPLVEGEIVAFQWTEDFGTAELCFESDGSFTLDCDEPRAPDGGHMNVAIDGDWESVSPSVEELVENIRDGGDSEGVETISFFAWSTGSDRFVFSSGEFSPAEPSSVPASEEA